MTEVLSGAYLLGRQLADLESPFKGEDKVYANQRLDDKTIADAYFAHCTFVNVSFKKATIERGRFVDCLFTSSYFRRAVVAGCTFSGCRFVDCDFPKTSVSGSRFQYCRFKGCYITYSQLRLNMPSEPNLRQEIAHNLAIETERMGFYAESADFRWDEIQSREQDLLLVIRGATEWYKKHYDLPLRALACIRLISSILNRHLWGYGERVWVLIRNLLLLSFLIFPISFLFARSGFSKKTGVVDISDLIGYSLIRILPVNVVSDISPVTPCAVFLTTLESAVGIIASGLIVSYLFRWILRR
jgi:hypothetical protein